MATRVNKMQKGGAKVTTDSTRVTVTPEKKTSRTLRLEKKGKGGATKRSRKY